MANTLANLIKDAELAIAAENASRNAIRTTPVNNTLRNLAVGSGALGAGTAGGYYGVGAMTQSDDAYARSLLNARRNAIPSAFRGQEQGLEAPMFSPDDLIGAGLGSKLAMLAGAGMTKMVGKNTLASLLKTAPKTQYELAHELAQKNASLPIEQGGLGLPANNTAMDRARAIGFDTPAYHGTADDVPAFEIGKAGTKMKKDWGDAAYLTPSASNAEYYAIEASRSGNAELQAAHQKLNSLMHNPPVKNGSPQYPAGTNEALEEMRAIGRYADANPVDANVMPLLIDTSRADKHMVSGGQTDPYLFQNSRMSERGKDMALIYDNPSRLSEIAVYDPTKIRSRFAAFDPMQRKSANLLATGAIGATGLTLADILNQEQYQ